ncbi:MAG: type II toxin-antitoxin system death-on-curing family toxin [Pseudomonadota bacterium]
MTEPVWLDTNLVAVLHDRALALAGGAPGVRDITLLQSALARPRNIHAFESTDLFELAATYAEGIARNHPFIDANKRTAFLSAALFLDLNGSQLRASHGSEHADAMVALAQRQMTRAAFAQHLRERSSPK